MRVVSAFSPSIIFWLVALAALVCVAGSWIALSLYGKARGSTGHQLYGWGFLAATALGSTVWCTHFIAMLAYDVAAPVTFDPVLTLGSLIVAISGCCVALLLGAYDPDEFSAWSIGALVGLSVAVMHYTGMAAYHVEGEVVWSDLYVKASVLISVAMGAAAFQILSMANSARGRAAAVATLVASVVGLHFTGMAAVSVTPVPGLGSFAHQESFQAVAVVVAGVALMVMGMGVASYLIEQQSTQESVERLRHMALNDALTGLPNRAHFTHYLETEVERAKGHMWRLAVIGIDLDRFKEINDVRGHDAGDAALRTIGARFADIILPGEFVARVGGDEFAAVKRYQNVDEVHDFAARIERELLEPLEIGGLKVVTGGSLGIALYPNDGDDAQRLVTNADLAMYRAKSDIQRSVCFYEVQMDEAARGRSALAADLRQAIERAELEVHYQVQNDVTSGDVTGYEVLLRWRHHALGFVPPAKFIPIAEETGLIVEIGAWVLRTACEEAASWPVPAKIAVNVSAVQLRTGDLAEQVHEVLVATGFPPDRLEIEITESSIIQDKSRVLHVLRRLRALGVTVALDDFGVGYSSFETLRTFPFDKIKLDRSFTEGLETDPQAKAIVRAVLALGKSLDIRVLAEGVETNDQLMVLRSEGCDLVQGYLLGRPTRQPSAGSAAAGASLAAA